MFYLTTFDESSCGVAARTIVTLLGLGLGVALVIAIASLSKGLDRAQKKTLDPLAGIGTDLTVTLSPQQEPEQLRRPGRRPAAAANRDLVRANLSVVTDLSKLGKPGTHFVHDFFLPGTQLTFQQNDAQHIARSPASPQVSEGLTLLAAAPGGRGAEDRRDAEDPAADLRRSDRNIPRPTQKEFAGDAGVLREARRHARQRQQQRRGRPRRRRRRRRRRAAAAAAPNRAAFAKCLPQRLQSSARTFTTPQQTLRQVLDPPQTNITTTAYTIGGVDQTNPSMGVVTTAQVTKGRYLAAAGGSEALVSQRTRRSTR